MNPYEILGVDRNANDETIKKAYRKLGREWHPDLFSKEQEKEIAELKMKEINEAYEILKTPEKRAAYDAENPISANVYDYYASKKTKGKGNKKKTNDSADIENEKQRRAILQFLDVEYKHKNEIFEMFAELATCAVNNEFSDEEYIDTLALILEEQQDCIMKIQKIISVARTKKIKGLASNLKQAQDAINELIQKGNETPSTLKQAHYVEETRKLTEKIHNKLKGFKRRLDSIYRFDILKMTWQFKDDNQLKASCKSHKRRRKSLLKDIEWIEKIAYERNVEIGLINVSDSSYYTNNITIDKFKQMVEECNKTYNMNLQKLREEFWNNKCRYSENSVGQTILSSVDAMDMEGDFICPPHISGIEHYAFYWLSSIHSISIPQHIINSYNEIELPHQGSLKYLILNFDGYSQTVDVSKIKAEVIVRKGNYICICGQKHYNSSFSFALVDSKGVYVYDDKKICELNGIRSIEKLTKRDSSWEYYIRSEGYQLQVHAWAQMVKKLPNPNIMEIIPANAESVKEWLSIDKTNLDKVYKTADDNLKSRIIRLYIALGALNGDSCYEQAERLISRLDVSKMYRSRLERVPEEKQLDKDPMFSVPKSIVDFVEDNIENEEFLPYIFAFLEGYKLFQSEVKKANVKLSPEFIIKMAPQYIFHTKVGNVTDFVKQLLEYEIHINRLKADKILRIYETAQRQSNSGKNIITTTDMDNTSVMHYKFFDMESLQTYTDFVDSFKDVRRKRYNSYYDVEAENVFLSTNSHAIEIIDGESKRIAIVILNLFDEGELFADIMSCENKSIDVLETIKRALIDQKNCNKEVTGISIGMNEAPSTSKHNKWREVAKKSNVDWIQKARWIKFEYLFENRTFGITSKVYRVRFMIEGKEQHFNDPNPYVSRKAMRIRYW